MRINPDDFRSPDPLFAQSSCGGCGQCASCRGLQAPRRQPPDVTPELPAGTTLEPDRIEISEEGRSAGERFSAEGGSLSQEQLTSEEEKQLEQLRQRDQEVRRHEQSHVAAAGPYVRGAPRYTFQVGPDGKAYAIGGEVAIDTSPVPNNPAATIRKAQAIRAAALAPANPSGQDRAVAAAASRLEAEARSELAEAPADAASSPVAAENEPSSEAPSRRPERSPQDQPTGRSVIGEITRAYGGYDPPGPFNTLA